MSEPGPGSSSSSRPIASRARLREVIVRRPRVGTITGLLLALLFALVVTPIVLAESWAVDPRVAPGQVAPVTVRLGADDVAAVIGARRTGGVVIARGEVATPLQAQAVAVAVADAPRGSAGFGAYGLVLFALAAGFTHHLKRSNRGRLLRVQLVLLGTIALGALVTKSLLLAYPLSVLAVPVALGAIVPTLVFDRTVGLATGVLAAVVMSLLVRFDVGVVTVLVVQAVSAAIVIPDRPRARWSLALAAGAVSLAGAALTYMAFAYLSSRALPFEELATPAASSFVAASVGGVMAGVLALPLLPLFELACGEITHRRLVALEDLSHPLLRQIATKAPGTWQHSLAMANLAEVAANAIGASGRLVRVGAYFHDLGKSLQPTYFIENLGAGEPSPHDQLAPEVSCDAIFAHVTEGILLARRHKLPERIVDFMHMHHGDGVLEYFWAKCQEQGNPRGLTVADFRYPGVPPQSRETAILAVCDAVEAASRTLKRPDARSVEILVQRIVYGKLHLGQLDESGLSMSDLRKMSDSLREAIRHAHHGRIEYPWQREAATEAAAAGAGTAVTVAEGRPPVADRGGLATQRLMTEPRLDSLDVPRPILWDDRGREAGLGAVITPPAVPLEIAAATSAPTPRRTSDLAAFGDTIDLAIATTAGLGAEPAAVPSPSPPRAAATTSAPASPVPASTGGPTADAFVDAVVNAEAPAAVTGRLRGLPRSSTAPERPTPPASGAAVAPPPAEPIAPAPAPTVDVTADAAVPVDAEQGLDPAERAARVTTAEIRVPIVATTTLPAPAAPLELDEAALRRAARPTEPILVRGIDLRAARAMVAALPPIPTNPVPAFHKAQSATFDVPERTPRIPAPPGSAPPDDDDEPEIEINDDPAVADDAAITDDVVLADDREVADAAAVTDAAEVADDAVIAEAPAAPPASPLTTLRGPPRPPVPSRSPRLIGAPTDVPSQPSGAAAAASSEWLGALSARIDALIEAGEELDDDAFSEHAVTDHRPARPPATAGAPGGASAPVTDDVHDGFAGETVRRQPPVPPGRTRPYPRSTQPVEPADVEATLELSPTMPVRAGGGFAGPPPATRVGRTAPPPLAPPPAAPAAPEAPPATDDGDDPDDRPTVVGPQPSGSMLPPRVRR